MKRLAAVLAALVLGPNAQAAPIAGSQHLVGNWRIGAYTFDNTGGFSHCAASATYRSGISMVFALSGNHTWRIGWTHPNWVLTKGQRLDIALHVDGGPANWVTAVAVSQTIAYAELPANAALFDLFRRGYHLTVTAQGNRYEFNLEGTYAALTELGACIAAYGSAGQPPNAPAGTAPPPIVGAKQPPPIIGPAASPSAPQPAAAAASLTAEQRLEATTLVANLLSQSDLAGFRILTARQLQEMNSPTLASWHVVWQAENVLGALRIVPPHMAASAAVISSAMIGDDSRLCGNGQFASGSTPDDKSRGTTRLFTACKTGKFAWETHYIVVPRDEGGFYLFATIGKSGTADTATVTHADGLLRAAVFQVLKH